jgi:hypothetical protein
MSDDNEKINLKEKFPDLTPVKSAPPLGSVNGIGVTMYGRRDYDRETNSYIATHCLIVLFIPVAALGAYRVANARGGGWYFLGKQPLSGFARLWNMLLASTLAACIGMGWWSAHTSSPDYIASKQISEANTLRDAGQFREAAMKYCTVANGIAKYAGEGRDSLLKIAQEQLLNMSAEDALSVYNMAAPFELRNQNGKADLYKRGMQLLDKHKAADPAGALKILESVSKYAASATDTDKLREELLAAAVAKDPSNVELASQLATIYEKRDELEKCEKLLAPLATTRGAPDGARILGQI